MFGCWCEVRRENAISPIAAPDIVPTASALSEAFQFIMELRFDNKSEARVPECSVTCSSAGFLAVHGAV